MADLTGHRLGRYQVIRLLGQGGMATVYLALDETRGTSVALKVLSPLLAENRSFLLRFQREARIVMRLRHPNIVPLEDSGESGGYAYLAMPYIEGGTLADRLRESPLSPSEAQRLIRQIASALQHAHDLAIVHRDVKPSNILRDPQGNALLSDFGLAQIQDASVSLTGSAMLGTPSYVSPEQVRGDPVDGRTDQYALGILLFQITTGRLPFEAETPLAILAKHANEPLPLPRSVSPGIPLGVEQVILKATAKEPDDRFPSISEMDRTFQQAMAHALDPARNRAPTIKLPSLSPSANAAQAASLSPRRSRRRLLLSGLVGGAFLVIVAAMALQGVLTGLDGTDGSAGAQLTELQGTIASLSTAVAGAGGALSPDAIATIVAATLGEPSGSSETPGAATTEPPEAATTEPPATATPALTRRPTASVTPVPPTATPQPTSPFTSTPILPLPTLPLPTLDLLGLSLVRPVSPTLVGWL